MNSSLGQAALPGNPGQTKTSRPKFPMGPIAGIVLLSAAVGAGFGAASATLLDNNSNSGTQVATGQPAAAQSTAAGSASSLTPAGSQVSVADLYAKLRPSVVKITALSSSTGSGGTGSGLVIDTKGNIVTNYHVISGSDKLDVRLSDGTSVEATVVGTDPGDDLAVIHIDPSGLSLTPVVLANSQTRVGDNVVAIGNPLDLEATLTEGVVSGLGRVLSSGNGRPLRELIQTDTAINPGNSGGGLFNLDGQLVGITNALENPSGQDSFSGIGYAIPVSTLQQYLPQMLAGQTVSHARLGVSLEDLSPAISSDLGLSVNQGVLIGSVESGSTAARAGLRGTQTSRFGSAVPGDVIVAIDGKTVNTYDDIASYLDTKNPGDSVTLTIIRDGQKMDVSLNLDAWTS
jgi:putative serine protease PepD